MWCALTTIAETEVAPTGPNPELLPSRVIPICWQSSCPYWNQRQGGGAVGGWWRSRHISWAHSHGPPGLPGWASGSRGGLPGLEAPPSRLQALKDSCPANQEQRTEAHTQTFSSPRSPCLGADITWLPDIHFSDLPQATSFLCPLCSHSFKRAYFSLRLSPF